MVVFCARAFATSIHWEDITPIGDDRLVVIDSSNLTYADLETACKALPLQSYGYAITVYGAVICMEAKPEADWDLIKEYIEEQFGGSD
jgi:hypothetical protein